jgi:threonine dehydrogenase-like Zn-dependent dehydrogenase
MRAVIRNTSGFALSPDVAAPTPQPGDAVIAPSRVGIASPDLVAGGRADMPSVIGHEFVGVVESVAPIAGRDEWNKVATAMVGKRVVGSPVVACGTCDLCKRGLSQHCPTRRVLGLRGLNGCLAERFSLPVANLVEVPKGVHDDQAVFANAVAAAVHAAQMLRIEGKPYVTVLGDGVMGLLCAQVMARLNASVRVLGTQPAKFMLCEKWGIKHRHVAEVGRRQDQDVVVDCTGSASGMELALQLVRPRGKVLLKAGPAPMTGLGGSGGEEKRGADLSLAATNEIDIVGSGAGRIGEGLNALAKNTVEVLSMISARFKLNDALAAIKLAGLSEAVKVVVEVGDGKR